MSILVRGIAGSLVSILLCVLSPPLANAAGLTLAVANSTCGAMEKAGELYTRESGVGIELICKSSGLLAKGLHGGSINADLYISANESWMNYMIGNHLVPADRVTVPWTNSLVAAAPAASPLHLTTWEALASGEVKTILIGDPSTAPFGRYTKQALESTGLWERVRDKIETRKHITLLAETLARAGPDTIGILFKTSVSGPIREIFPVDASWHPAIRYYMAPIGEAANDTRVADLIAFIDSPRAREIFLAAGFGLASP